MSGFRKRCLTARGQRNSERNFKPEPAISGSRWHSGASPNSLGIEGGKARIETEEDVLHIRTLPTFDGTIGQADSELLISYLTVPYLRLPLMLQYFATQNRLHALASPQVRKEGVPLRDLPRPSTTFHALP